jgi:hypothetical protein
MLMIFNFFALFYLFLFLLLPRFISRLFIVKLNSIISTLLLDIHRLLFPDFTLVPVYSPVVSRAIEFTCDWNYSRQVELLDFKQFLLGFNIPNADLLIAAGDESIGLDSLNHDYWCTVSDCLGFAVFPAILYTVQSLKLGTTRNEKNSLTKVETARQICAVL